MVRFLYKRMTTSSSSMKRYTTTEQGGRQNMFAHEPEIEVLDQDYWTNAELINGRLAMVGLVIGIFNYTVFGWVIPGFV